MASIRSINARMEYRALGNTGLRLSILGLGAAPLGNEYGNIQVAEGERAVQTAIEHGINLFDTSPYYGRTLSEERLGTAFSGSGHVDWKSVVAALEQLHYDGWLTIESFGFALGKLSSAASIWRHLAPTPEDIAWQGIEFLKSAHN